MNVAVEQLWPVKTSAKKSSSGKSKFDFRTARSVGLAIISSSAKDVDRNNWAVSSQNEVAGPQSIQSATLSFRARRVYAPFCNVIGHD